MVAQVTMLHLKAGMMDELIRCVQDTAAPARIAQPGFGGMALLTDPITNHALLIGYWDVEAALQAMEQNTQAQLAQFADLITIAPESTTYEVSVQIELTVDGSAYIRGI